MGLAVAQRLVLDGIMSIALVDITESALTTARASLSNLNPDCKILTLGVDVSVEDQVNTAVQITVQTFGRFDICFNAAGISGPQGGITEQTLEGMEKVLSVNLRGVWLCERAQVRQMMAQEMRAVR